MNHPRILIRQLAMQACIGVHEWEQGDPQPVLVDLDIALQACLASTTDRLEDTVDYDAVIERLRSVATRHHALAEAMASSMCASVLADHRVASVRLTLMKLGPYPGAQVGVTLQRRQHGSLTTTRENAHVDQRV